METNLPSIATLRKWYNEFNILYFNKKLPFIPIDYTISKMAVGRVTYNWTNKKLISLSINKKFKFTTTEYQSILLHEMIHVYQFVNNIRPDHSFSFINKMNEINKITSNYYNVSKKYDGKLHIRESLYKECFLITFKSGEFIGFLKTTEKTLDNAICRLRRVFNNINIYVCKGANSEKLPYYRMNTRTYNKCTPNEFINLFNHEIIQHKEVLYVK